MRRPLTFILFFTLGMFASIAPRAQDMRWEVLDPDERAFIDRLAADFYEDSLRRSQAQAIEARTSRIYAGAAPVDRARFRDLRREGWREMTPSQRRALRGVKRPAYRNLAEEQKTPFRSIALDKLGAAGALDAEALSAALSKDI